MGCCSRKAEASGTAIVALVGVTVGILGDPNTATADGNIDVGCDDGDGDGTLVDARESSVNFGGIKARWEL